MTDTDIDTTTALDVARDVHQLVRWDIATVENGVAVDVRPLDVPTPPTQVERRCANCVYWVHEYAGMGECMLPWDFDSDVRIEADGAVNPKFMTPARHSCAGWEAPQETNHD